MVEKRGVKIFDFSVSEDRSEIGKMFDLLM